MPYFITMTKAGTSIKNLRLTIEPREHRLVHGKFVYPKKDIEEGGGLHVYFDEHGHFVLPEALAGPKPGKKEKDTRVSVYRGGVLDPKQRAVWVAELKTVYSWLTPEKAQKIYDWLTDPLPNADGTDKGIEDRKYPENEAYAMTNGYQINLADLDVHWARCEVIKQIQRTTSVLAQDALEDAHKQQSESYLATEVEARTISAPLVETVPDEVVTRGRGRPSKRPAVTSIGR